METSKRHTAGSIKVSEEVILKIAETAACEIEGVAIKGQHLEAPSAMSKFRGPVRARILGEAAAIKFDISVIDGYNAVNVAENIQRSVKSAVQNMTGFTVTKVDVNIAGVSYKENEQSAAEEKTEVDK